MANHRYDPLGGQCRCGKHKYHAEHFNGDGELAGEAYKAHLARQQNHVAWLADLSAGDFAQVRLGDYDQFFAGRDNRIVKVVQRGSDGTIRQSSGDGRDFLVRTPRSTEIDTWWCNSNVLEQAQMPIPPKFASIDEADEWLERNAVEFGFDPGPKPEQPMFDTQEEADEWLRRNAGDPFVPASWQDTASITTEAVRKLTAEQLDAVMAKIITQGMADRESVKINIEELTNDFTSGFRGKSATLSILDEASAFEAGQHNAIMDSWPPQVSPQKIGGVDGKRVPWAEYGMTPQRKITKVTPGGPPPPGSMPTPVRTWTCGVCGQSFSDTQANPVRIHECPPLRFTFTCPGCHLTSSNPNDVRERYCGACHQFWP